MQFLLKGMSSYFMAIGSLCIAIVAVNGIQESSTPVNHQEIQEKRIPNLRNGVFTSAHAREDKSKDLESGYLIQEPKRNLNITKKKREIESTILGKRRKRQKMLNRRRKGHRSRVSRRRNFRKKGRKRLSNQRALIRAGSPQQKIPVEIKYMSEPSTFYFGKEGSDSDMYASYKPYENEAYPNNILLSSTDDKNLFAREQMEIDYLPEKQAAAIPWDTPDSSVELSYAEYKRLNNVSISSKMLSRQRFSSVFQAASEENISPWIEVQPTEFRTYLDSEHLPVRLGLSLRIAEDNSTLNTSIKYNIFTANMKKVISLKEKKGEITDNLEILLEILEKCLDQCENVILQLHDLLKYTFVTVIFDQYRWKNVDMVDLSIDILKTFDGMIQKLARAEEYITGTSQLSNVSNILTQTKIPDKYTYDVLFPELEETYQRLMESSSVSQMFSNNSSNSNNTGVETLFSGIPDVLNPISQNLAITEMKKKLVDMNLNLLYKNVFSRGWRIGQAPKLANNSLLFMGNGTECKVISFRVINQIAQLLRNASIVGRGKVALGVIKTNIVGKCSPIAFDSLPFIKTNKTENTDLVEDLKKPFNRWSNNLKLPNTGLELPKKDLKLPKKRSVSWRPLESKVENLYNSYQNLMSFDLLPNWNNLFFAIEDFKPHVKLLKDRGNARDALQHLHTVLIKPGESTFKEMPRDTELAKDYIAEVRDRVSTKRLEKTLSTIVALVAVLSDALKKISARNQRKPEAIIIGMINIADKFSGIFEGILSISDIILLGIEIFMTPLATLGSFALQRPTPIEGGYWQLEERFLDTFKKIDEAVQIILQGEGDIAYLDQKVLDYMTYNESLDFKIGLAFNLIRKMEVKVLTREYIVKDCVCQLKTLALILINDIEASWSNYSSNVNASSFVCNMIYTIRSMSLSPYADSMSLFSKIRPLTLYTKWYCMNNTNTVNFTVPKDIIRKEWSFLVHATSSDTTSKRLAVVTEKIHSPIVVINKRDADFNWKKQKDKYVDSVLPQANNEHFDSKMHSTHQEIRLSPQSSNSFTDDFVRDKHYQNEYDLHKRKIYLRKPNEVNAYRNRMSYFLREKKSSSKENEAELKNRRDLLEDMEPKRIKLKRRNALNLDAILMASNTSSKRVRRHISDVMKNTPLQGKRKRSNLLTKTGTSKNQHRRNQRSELQKIQREIGIDFKKPFIQETKKSRRNIDNKSEVNKTVGYGVKHTKSIRMDSLGSTHQTKATQKDYAVETAQLRPDKNQAHRNAGKVRNLEQKAAGRHLQEPEDTTLLHFEEADLHLKGLNFEKMLAEPDN